MSNLSSIDIKEYVSKFIEEYFEDIDKVVNHNFEFIERLSLKEPKVDYLKAEGVITTVINNLKYLDNSIMKGTCVKLVEDIKNLKIFYKKFIDETKQMKLIKDDYIKSLNFYQELTNRLNTLEDDAELLRDKLNSINSSKNSDKVNLDELTKKEEEVKNEIEKLKDIKDNSNREFILSTEAFEKNFNFEFLKAMRYYAKSIRNIINIKYFYLELILWERAKKSKSIRNFFANLKDEEFNTKIFIKKQLKSTPANSDKHERLKYYLKVWGKIV